MNVTVDTYFECVDDIKFFLMRAEDNDL